MNIKGRVAIITGAGSGIGQAVAIQLAKRGVQGLGLVDRSDSVLTVAQVINEEFGNGRAIAAPFVGDTTSESFRKKTFDLVTADYGIPTILVPAAGITRDRLAVKVDKETGRADLYPVENFRLVVEVNLVAPVYWAIELVGRIAEDRVRRGLHRWEPEEGIQGEVVFIGSVSSSGNIGQISYASTKAGLEGAEATFAKEAIFHGVRSAIIHPGFTNTPMVRAMGEDMIKKNILPYTRLRRLIEPAEIADAICFLITNSAVSGQLWADAGWHPPT